MKLEIQVDVNLKKIIKLTDEANELVNQLKEKLKEIEDVRIQVS
ncbi:hypothetical protein [Vagococcus fluvialis]|nr:hypothetical protein [Vagococcus fluvialis]